MSEAPRFVVQEKITDRWVPLAKIACPDRTTAHLEELKAVAPEPAPGKRYRVIREGSPERQEVHSDFS